jgi:hypothetical protein
VCRLGHCVLDDTRRLRERVLIIFQVPVCSGEMQLLSTNTHSDISFYCADIRQATALADRAWQRILWYRHFIRELEYSHSIICCMDAEVTTPYLRRHAVGHILQSFHSCNIVFLHSPNPNSSSYVINLR